MKEKVQHGNLKNNFMFKKCLLFTLTFFAFFSCADKKHEIKREQKDTTKVFGCMDTTMFNYNPLANTQPANVCIPKFNSDSAYSKSVALSGSSHHGSHLPTGAM